MALRDSRQTRKTGYLYKLGDGPINFNWNMRYCILDHWTFLYFTEPTERNPRGIFDIREAGISQLYSLRGNDYSFTLQLANGRVYHFSHKDGKEAEGWRKALIEAAHVSMIGSDGENDLFDFNKFAEDKIASPRRKRKVSVGDVPVDLRNSVENLQTNSDFKNKSWGLCGLKYGVRVHVRDYKEWSFGLRHVCKIYLDKDMIIFLMLISFFYYFNVKWLLQASFFFVLGYLRYGTPYLPAPRFKTIGAKTMIQSEASDIFSAIMDLENRKQWDATIDHIKILETIDSHTDYLYAELNPGKTSSIFRTLIKPRMVVMKRYWMHQNGTYYIIFKSQPQSPFYISTKVKLDIYEGFIITQIDKNNCSVTLISNIEYRTPLFYIEETIKLNRAQLLAALREFVLQDALEEKADYLSHIDSIETNFRKKEEEQARKLSLYSGNYIKYSSGERVPLETRIPGYIRNKSGGIKCANRVRYKQSDLDSQKGLIMELIKKAGKTLMEGKHIVGVSLPVRIFEPRSTLERMVEWWCTAPLYLNNAVVAVFNM